MSEEIRALPHALGPEKSVLSSLMKSPGLLAEHPLDPEIFYLPGHRTIYRFMREADFELVAFVNRLHQAGELDDVGGPGVVSDLFTYAPNQSSFDRHLGILRGCYARRMAIRACCSATEAAYDMAEGEDSGNYLAALSGPITAVFDAAAATAPPKDTKALARELMENFERKVRGEVLPMGILTGMPEIDRYMRGLHPQHMGIISARSGGGKSTLGTQFAANIATAGVGVLYLILERTEGSAFERAVIQTAGIHHGALTDPQAYAELQGLSKPDHGTLISIRSALTRLTDANLHIRKPPNRRLATQCAEIRRHVRLHGVKVVFVDQIGLVRGDRKKGDSEEVEKRGVSNALQELAHELGITVIVMSQITDDGDTKGARAIEEDADWHLQIVQERDRKKENFGEHQHILFAKHSHNTEANGQRLPLVLDHATLRFIYGFPQKPEGEKKKKDRYSK